MNGMNGMKNGTIIQLTQFSKYVHKTEYIELKSSVGWTVQVILRMLYCSFRNCYFRLYFIILNSLPFLFRWFFSNFASKVRSFEHSHELNGMTETFNFCRISASCISSERFGALWFCDTFCKSVKQMVLVRLCSKNSTIFPETAKVWEPRYFSFKPNNLCC